jgi:hypothetical protein
VSVDTDAGLKQAARLLRRECTHIGQDAGDACCSWTVAALDVERLADDIRNSEKFILTLRRGLDEAREVNGYKNKAAARYKWKKLYAEKLNEIARLREQERNSASAILKLEAENAGLRTRLSVLVKRIEKYTERRIEEGPDWEYTKLSDELHRAQREPK